MTTHGREQAVHLTVLALGAYVFLFHGLFHGELKPLDDCWNAGVARRIAEGGSWLSPTLQDGEFHNHAVLVQWIIAVLFKIFGPQPGLARLPGAVFGAALVFAVYRTGLRRSTPFAAFIAAAGLLTFEPYFHIAPRPLMDVPVTFWIFLALLAIDEARTRPWFGYLVAGAFTGIAILTKDLAGLAPFPVALVLILVERRPKALLHPAPYVGFALAAAIVSAWLVPQHMLNGGAWLTEYLKFGKWGIEEGAYPDRGPFFYAAHLGSNFWPWLPILLVALFRGGRQLLRGEAHPRAVHIVAFLVIFLAWSAAAHKTIRYMILFYPSTFLLVGDELDGWLRWPRFRQALVALLSAGALGLGIAELGFGFDLHPARSEDGALAKDLAPKALAATVPAHDLCTYHVHRYFLAAAFSYYRGPTVPMSLDLRDAEAVKAYLAPGSSRRCITTPAARPELGSGPVALMNADGYVLVGAP